MKKKFSVIVLIVLVLFSSAGCNLIDKMEELKNLEIGEVDLSVLDNGIYTGSYDGGLVSAKVKVTVKDHKIINIEILEHDNGRGEAAESIIDKIIEIQSLDVDVVSGATASSKVICKAIENSLRQK